MSWPPICWWKEQGMRVILMATACLLACSGSSVARFRFGRFALTTFCVFVLTLYTSETTRQLNAKLVKQAKQNIWPPCLLAPAGRTNSVHADALDLRERERDREKALPDIFVSLFTPTSKLQKVCYWRQETINVVFASE
jgi:hypothetical protein